MEQFDFVNDKDEYSTSRGRYFKYFFNNNGQEGLLIIGETDDYFYFTISLRKGYLKDRFNLEVRTNNLLYNKLVNLINGYESIGVYEEGTPEKKSICFQKSNGPIEIIFNLTSEERPFYTIELANLRRLGDTRFVKLVPEGECSEKEFYEMKETFRYKFKARIHKLLDELEHELKASKDLKNAQENI